MVDLIQFIVQLMKITCRVDWRKNEGHVYIIGEGELLYVLARHVFPALQWCSSCQGSGRVSNFGLVLLLIGTQSLAVLRGCATYRPLNHSFSSLIVLSWLNSVRNWLIPDSADALIDWDISRKLKLFDLQCSLETCYCTWRPVFLELLEMSQNHILLFNT